MSNPSISNFSKRRKSPAKKVIGKQYTDFLRNCLVSVTGEDLDRQLVFAENSPVDFVWCLLSLGMECKRLMATKKKNDGSSKAWLKREFIDRFTEYTQNTGKILNARILCVTEKKWSSNVDAWLVNQGYYVLETGQIENALQKAIASKKFFDGFTDVLVDIVKDKINPRCL
jgi:hypothetical protein